VYILQRICDSILSSWRSEIGKAGRRAVLELWASNPGRFQTAESRRDYVSNAIKNARFIYKYPDASTNREPFCSDLVSKVYATHLRKIIVLDDYENQTGALALATVAVERGLSFFKTGEDALKMYRNAQSSSRWNRNPRSFNFINNPWGMKARQLVAVTKRIQEPGWAAIIASASKIFSARPGIPEVGEGVVGDKSTSNIYSQIKFD